MLATLPRNQDPNLLVGYDTSDDAGVYRLTDELALITTADYITPPVDDPYVYGQIAAANAISDVYAMGGRPLTCLNLVSFTSKKLPADTLHQIVAGALQKITEAGAVLAGTGVAEVPAPLRWLRAVAPKPHVGFLLDVIEVEALARKPEEGGVEHLAEARRAFRDLAAREGMVVMPAHFSQAQVYESVVHETLARFYLRYRTFVNWLYLSNPGQMNPKAWRASKVYRQGQEREA